MGAFFVPTPCIVALRVPTFSESKNIDTTTKIEILCETELPNIEVYYTIDGSKPQPYFGIVQGSKIHKFGSPFCLPPGKVTVKAIAIHSFIHTLCSNVITKNFRVDSVEKDTKRSKSKLSLVRKKKLHPSDYQVVHQANEQNAPDLGINIKEFKYKENEILPTENISIAITDSSELVDLAEPKDREIIQIQELDVECEQDTDNELSESFTKCLVEEFPECVEIQDAEDKKVVDEPQDSPPSTLLHHCAQCEMPLQHCLACNKVNSLISRYCDKCGGKLYKICFNCKEPNPAIAVFCQYCGKKLKPRTEDSNQDHDKFFPKTRSIGVAAKPVFFEKSTQRSLPSPKHQSVQTLPLHVKIEKSKILKKKLPISTPGRGYWHQQLDYICNHLKANAYNNLEFRKLIGEPALGHFLSADIVEKEDNITIHISFRSLSAKQMPLSESQPEIEN